MTNICSFFYFFTDILGLIYRTRGRLIEIEDMHALSPELASGTLSAQLEAAFKASRGNSAGSRLRRALWKCFRCNYVLSGMCLLISNACMLASALILRLFLLSNSTSTQVMTGMGLIFVVWLSCVCKSLYDTAWRDVGNRTIIALRGLIVRFLLTKTRLKKHDGRLLNLLTGDMVHIFLSNHSPYYLVVSPLSFAVLLISMCLLYDYDALLGIPVVFLFAFTGMKIAKWNQTYLDPLLKVRDLRLNALQQSINGIYTIKASQMEQAILQLFANYRLMELWYLLRRNLISGLQNSLVYVIKFPVITVVIAAYLLIHSDALTASYIFPLALLYQILQQIGTYNLSYAVQQVVEFSHIINRIGNFIELQTGVEKKIINEKLVRKLSTDIIQKTTKFYQIFGKTGSGKTSLAENLLISLSDTDLVVAFSAQKPWLINSTIRENILCGRPFDHERYWKTISACQLLFDLNNTKEGDQTQVGEDGAKLSGGQRARVAIARAVYSDADVYIFDDPFKSLNKTVSNELNNAAFKNLLKHKTRILIGSKYHMCPENCDQLFRLKRDLGLEELAETNGYEDSDYESSTDEMQMQIQNEVAPQLLSECHLNSKTVVNYDDNRMMQENEQLLKKRSDKRSNRFKTVRNFCRFFGFAPVWLRCTTLILMLLGQIVIIFSDVWLYFWVVCTEACDQWFYFKIYAGISALAFLLCFVRAIFLRYLCHVVSRNIQNQLVANIIHAPMSFFWNADSGEVLNLFSSDSSHLDHEIPKFMDLAIQSTFSFLGFVVTIGCLYPIVIVFLLPVLLLLFLIQEVSLRIGQETSRLVAETLAPVLQTFSSITTGLTTIKAFRLENYMQSSLFELIDRNTIPRECSMRSESFLLNTVVLAFSAFISVFVIASIVMGENSAAAGLVLYYGILLLFQSPIAFDAQLKLDLAMVHFYRLLEYMDLKSETDPNFGIFKEKKQFAANGCIKHYNTSALKNMLMTGIEAKQVGVQYKANHNWAIKDKNISIRGGEITGIAGRTGCGKSTFLSALYRMVEFQGTIEVGKCDTKSLSLAELRGCFAMLPQESMIFYKETIRWNLDPYHRCSEESIWNAFSVLDIKHVITRLPLGLETLLKDAELSSGETRLFCFARVLLNSQGKILLLDEPTDSVDFETEKKIWEAIRKILQDQTIIVVAHSRTLLKRCDQIIQFGDE